MRGVREKPESGITRCLIKPDEVACEAGQTPTQPHTGFLQAPMGQIFHWDLAIVTTAGNFRWAEGNIGTAYPNGDMVTFGCHWHDGKSSAAQRVPTKPTPLRSPVD